MSTRAIVVKFLDYSEIPEFRKFICDQPMDDDELLQKMLAGNRKRILRWIPFKPRGAYVAAQYWPAIGMHVASLSAKNIQLPHSTSLLARKEWTMGEFKNVGNGEYVYLPDADNVDNSQRIVNVYTRTLTFSATEGAILYKHKNHSSNVIRYEFRVERGIAELISAEYNMNHVITTKMYAYGKLCRIRINNMNTGVLTCINPEGDEAIEYYNDEIISVTIGRKVYRLPSPLVTIKSPSCVKLHLADTVETYALTHNYNWRLTKAVFTY